MPSLSLPSQNSLQSSSSFSSPSQSLSTASHSVSLASHSGDVYTQLQPEAPLQVASTPSPQAPTFEQVGHSGSASSTEPLPSLSSPSQISGVCSSSGGRSV